MTRSKSLIEKPKRTRARHCAVASGSTFVRWADWDPSYRGNNRLSIYQTKADQRGNRPDLKPIKVKVTVL
jgi:hypothetical protein